MTTQEKMDLAKVILPTLAGAAGSVVNSRQQSQANKQNQQQLQLGQMGNQANIAQMLQQMKMQQAAQGLNAMPLGLEQQYLQKQRMMQALLPAMAKYQSARPTDPGILSAYKPGSNVLQQFASNPALQQSFSDNATESSMANYRKLVAQADPRMNIGSLNQLGLSGQYDQGINDVQMTALADQKAYEQGQTDLAQRQTDMTTGSSTAAAPEKKKGGFWSKVGSIAKVAVPIVLAATGVGIPAAMAITAGTNIAASKMQGKDWGDAIQSGVIGAATGAVGAGALGSATRAGLGTAAQKAIVTGGLNAADTKMQGGTTGQALQSGLMSGVGSALSSRMNNGGSSGLNNQMGPQSLPLGSGYSDANNPGVGWAQALKNSPSLQLQSSPLASSMTPQGVQDNNASQMYPMQNKVKAAVTGLPPNQFTLNPGQMQGSGTASPQPPLNPQQQQMKSQIMTSPQQQGREGLEALQNQRKQFEQQNYHKAYSNTAQMIPPQQQQGMPQLQRGLPMETLSNEFYQRLMQNPLVTTLNSPGGAIAAAALTGQIGSQYQTGLNNQQNIANVMGQMGKNSGVNNAEFNMAAQDVFKSVPGRVTQELPVDQLNAYRIMQAMKAPNGMDTANRAAFNMEAQNTFNNIPGQITQQMDPVKMQQLLANYARVRAAISGGR